MPITIPMSVGIGVRFLVCARASLTLVLTAVAFWLIAGGAGSPVNSADASTCPSPGGADQDFQPSDAIMKAGHDLVVAGGGWGHGVGMSQYGALGAAQGGCTHQQILSTYYNGASVTSRTMPSTVRVGFQQRVTLTFLHAEGGNVPWQLCHGGCSTVATQPGGSTWEVRATSDGTFILRSGGTEVWRGGKGGQLRAAHEGTIVGVRENASGSSGFNRRVRWGHTQYEADGSVLYTVQHITTASGSTGMERYLWGIREVPVSWPTETLRAQIVAARSYGLNRIGLSSRQNDCRCDLYATVRDQVYRGWDHEAEDRATGSRWKNAVDATSGRVAVYGGSVIDAFYSSSQGGRSDPAEHVWGASVPYLQSVDTSRWEVNSGNPRHRWEVGFSAAELASRFDLQRFDDLEIVARGPGGRPTVKDLSGNGQPDGVRVSGQAPNGSLVTRWYSGEQFRSRLGLNSARADVFEPVQIAPAKPGIFRDRDWYLRNSLSGGGADIHFRYGRADDIPLVGDWNGDGRQTPGVFRDGDWYLRNSPSGGGADIHFRYGRADDTSLVWR
jgi:stage II sporulation protein D